MFSSVTYVGVYFTNFLLATHVFLIAVDLKGSQQYSNTDSADDINIFNSEKLQF